MSWGCRCCCWSSCICCCRVDTWKRSWESLCSLQGDWGRGYSSQIIKRVVSVKRDNKSTIPAGEIKSYCMQCCKVNILEQALLYLHRLGTIIISTGFPPMWISETRIPNGWIDIIMILIEDDITSLRSSYNLRSNPNNHRNSRTSRSVLGHKISKFVRLRTPGADAESLSWSLHHCLYTEIRHNLPKYWQEVLTFVHNLIRRYTLELIILLKKSHLTYGHLYITVS